MGLVVKSRGESCSPGLLVESSSMISPSSVGLLEGSKAPALPGEAASEFPFPAALSFLSPVFGVDTTADESNGLDAKVEICSTWFPSMDRT